MLHSIKSLLSQQIISIDLDYIKDMGERYDNNPVVKINNNFLIKYKNDVVSHFILSDEYILMCILNDEQDYDEIIIRDFYRTYDFDIYMLLTETKCVQNDHQVINWEPK